MHRKLYCSTAVRHGTPRHGSRRKLLPLMQASLGVWMWLPAPVACPPCGCSTHAAPQLRSHYLVRAAWVDGAPTLRGVTAGCWGRPAACCTASSL